MGQLYNKEISYQSQAGRETLHPYVVVEKIP